MGITKDGQLFIISSKYKVGDEVTFTDQTSKSNPKLTLFHGTVTEAEPDYIIVEADQKHYFFGLREQDDYNVAKIAKQEMKIVA